MICTVWHSCSYDFSVCNPFHPVLALHLFDAMVFNVLSMHTDQTHKGVRFIFIWGLSMGISSAIMLGVSCYASSFCEPQLALSLSALLQASAFTLDSWLKGCVLCPHLSYLPIFHATLLPYPISYVRNKLVCVKK